MTPNDMVVAILFVIVMATLFSQRAASQRQERQINRIKLRSDLILQHLAIALPDPLSDRVKQAALDPKRRIAAIKLYRQETHASLPEAKAAIDDFIRHHRAD